MVRIQLHIETLNRFSQKGYPGCGGMYAAWIN